jgi:Ca2+-binding RTX toxin-like protein
MSTMKVTLGAAVLAEAAYLDISLAAGQELTGGELAAAIRGAPNFDDNPLTDTEIALITDEYDLVAMQLTGMSGFQAMVFRRHSAVGQAGDYVLAIRGTAGAIDWVSDGALEMVAAAGAQDAALLAFVDRLTLPEAQGGYGLTLPNGSLDATGHSLGGHLVQALVSARPEPLHAGYTFNGGGLGVNLNNPVANIVLALRAAWEQFGGVPTNVTNVIGEAGLEVVPTALTGPSVGDIAEVFTEKQTLPWQDHSMAQLVDSLIVFRAFEALVGRAQFDLDTVSTILRAASASPLASLENVMNALASLFPASGASSTIAFADRGGLHQSADRLTSHLTGPGGTGGSYDVINLLQSPTQLAAVASQDDAQGLAYRYALVNAVPFVVGGVDYAALFNGTGRYDATNFSAEYLAARAQYLAAQFDANTRDLPFSPGIASGLVYRDLPSASTLGNVTLPDVANSRQVVFGDDLMDDTIGGGDLADQLFGGGGNDTLEGGAGNDLLDGGAGDDILKGGSGVTTARGGLGNDTYRYYSGDGLLKITDTLGSNHISINLDGGNLSYTLGHDELRRASATGNTWTDEHKNLYTLTSGKLAVKLQDGGAIEIDQFSSGNFGIVLGAYAPPEPPSQPVIYAVGAPNQIVSYPNGNTPEFAAQVNAMGFYQASDIANAGWVSGGAYFHRREIEQISVSAPLPSAAPIQNPTRAEGGMGDSYITGDAGDNSLRDDTEWYWTDQVPSSQWGIPPEGGGLGLYFVEPNLALGIVGPNYWMSSQMGNDVIDAGGGNDVVWTGGGDDTVYGGDGDDTIIDTHSGAEARPDQTYTFNGVTASGLTYFYSWGSTEWVDQPGHSSDDRLFGDAGNDWLYSHGGDQLLDGGSGNDQLVAGAGDDVLIGGAGDDVLAADIHLFEYPSQSTYPYASDTVEYGNDFLDGEDGADRLHGGGGNDTLLGGAGDDHLEGDFEGRPQLAADPASIAGDDLIYGGSGDDHIYGGGGNDTIDGESDNDTIYAGAGDDIVDGGSGIDTLQGDDASGPQGDDKLSGGDGDDTLLGLGGSDILDGGANSDVLDGGPGDDLLDGGAGNDVVAGGEGRDILLGTRGGDLLQGGSDTDTYMLFQGGGDLVIDDPTGSNLLTFAAGVKANDIALRIVGERVVVQYAATDSATMDIATFETMSSVAFTQPGEPSLTLDDLRHRFLPEPIANGALTLANGVPVAELLTAAVNDDLVLGYAGAQSGWVDTGDLTQRGVLYRTAPGSDYGMPAGSEAIVLINWYKAAAGSYLTHVTDGESGVLSLASASVDLTRIFNGTQAAEQIAGTANGDALYGNDGADLLIAAEGNDYLVGGEGGDFLVGGSGNDTYRVEVNGGVDVALDEAGAGDVLSFGAGIAPGDLMLSETAGGIMVQVGAAGTGTAVLLLDQSSMGGQVQPIEAFAFQDGTVWNSAQIDSHTNHAPFLVSMVPTQIARVGTAFSVAADSFVDNDAGDQLTHSAALADGQMLPSWLTFNPTTRQLSGTPPVDALGSVAVRITAEDLGGLSDSLVFEISVLAAAEGTAGDDTLTGDVGDNAMDGLAGNDTLLGLAGADSLAGSAGDDVLDGGSGVDVLIGGAGHDSYVVDETADIVVEAIGEGTDTVNAGVTYVLSNNVENLILTGSGHLAGYGNASNNTLTGNEGNNLLDGGPGADTMIGGAGDDSFVVDNSGDVVSEAAGAGTDTVHTALAYVLGTEVENLMLTGSASVGGRGNAADNIIIGNAGDNTITGDRGNDRLEGGAGNDVYVGGYPTLWGQIDTPLGNNTYVFGIGNGVDLIETQRDSTPGKINTVELTDGLLPSDIRLSVDGSSHLVIGLQNRGDRILVENMLVTDPASGQVTFSHEYNPLQQIRFADGSVWKLPYVMGASEQDLAMGAAGALAVIGNSLANRITGTMYGDVIDGGQGAADVLIGGAGDDTYIVDTTRTHYFWSDGTELWNFIDTVEEAAGEGDDTIIVRQAYSAFLPGNVENLVVEGTIPSLSTSHSAAEDIRRRFVGNALDNVIDASDAGVAAWQPGDVYLSGDVAIDPKETVIDGGAGADLMIGPAGKTRFVIDNPGDVVIANHPYTSIDTWFSYSLAGTEYDEIRLLGNALTSAVGNGSGNVLDGALNSAANVLSGGGGNDTYVVGAGDTIVENEVGDQDTVVIAGNMGSTHSLDGFANIEHISAYSAAGAVTLIGNAGNNRITGNNLANTLIGGAGNDTLDGGLANDTLIGGTGNDTYVVQQSNDVTLENPGEGTDVVQSSASWVLSANIENLTLTGTASIAGAGNALDNILIGNTAANALVGAGGNDTLNGGGGADALSGGSGDDYYYVDNVADTVYEAPGEGMDTVRSSVTFALGADTEHLELTGYSGINGTGNELDNVLTGNHGSNVLDGGAGADTLVGGDGNDTYIVDTAGDVVIESAEGGSGDGVMSSMDYALGAHVEKLTLVGTTNLGGDGNELDNIIIGNGGSNALSGGLGNDTLDGGAGDDVLIGGRGDDTYVVDSAEDELIENPDEGVDLVRTSITWTLGADFEDLVLTGSAAVDGIGNARQNVLTGNSAGNLLNGGDGADTLSGGSGDDSYYVDDVGDTVVETSSSGGTDAVFSSVSFALPTYVERLTLTGSSAISGTGNSAANVLIGNAADNTLDGGSGADTMSGGLGDDLYVVNSVGDIVNEAAGEGTDTVQSTQTHTLSANVENLILQGSTAVNGTGNALDNVFTGNSGTNVLTGGAGNDTYVIQNSTDTTVEAAGGGADTVQSSVTHTLAVEVENLTLTGSSAINATGNSLNNLLVGNTAANTLNGGAGADAMSGGAGDDTYVVDNAGDTVTEQLSEGIDLVQSSVSWTQGANVENLTLTGSSAVDGTGNALNNVLAGNTGTNVLTGGAGDDTFVVQNTTDSVVELAGGGVDLVRSSVTFTLSAEVENLTLTGSSAVNGTGNALGNVVTGNSGANTLTGGMGDDTYVVQNTTDVVVEAAGAGTDWVQASVTSTLAANVENLTLTGVSAINAIGNTLGNVLVGNSANNTLNGGAGSDTMAGGLGNDSYVVDNVGDLVTEQAGEGTDTIQSSASWTLGSNVENLTLTGSVAIHATGNTLDNVLTGNSGVNTLTGGSGNDTYVVQNATDAVVELAGEGTDTVQSTVAWTLGATLENLTLTGSSSVNGTGNALDNVLVGNSGRNTLTGDAGNDALNPGSGGTDVVRGGAGNDVYTLTRASGVTITENANEGIDLVSASVTHTLAANVELLFQTGSSAINGTGNALANMLRGNTANNTLAGGGGVDILEGGAGNDTLSNTTGNSLLNGGAGTDSLSGASGNDLFIGGAGNDTITTGRGADIIVFNKGDGSDTVSVSTGADNTLSLGGGTQYADLLLQKSGNDLILKIGATDQITFAGYYAATANRSVSTLQIVIEGTSEYLPGGGDSLRDNKVETFDFEGMVAAFDAALVVDPGLTIWALSSALAGNALGGSDTAALGGDLAYRHNLLGTLSDISFAPAQGILGAAGFGLSAQALQAVAGLHDATPRLN